MDTCWRSVYISALLLCVLCPLVTAINCYNCTDQLSNKWCNVATASCSGSCYTTIKKLESVGKRYVKGCMATSECQKLEILNHRKYCPFYPSQCTYCCTDRALCNDFNAAGRLYSHWAVLVGMIVTTGGQLLNLYFH